MRKILICLIGAIILSSCGNTITKDETVSDLPVEVQNMLKNKLYDTVYMIKTDNKLYIFNTEETPLYTVRTDSITEILLFIIIILFILMILI